MQQFIKTLQERVAGFLIFMMLVTSVFVTPSAYAATYTFTQSNWSGGSVNSTGTHPGDQTGWTKYASSTNIATSSNSLRLASSTITLTHTFEDIALRGTVTTDTAADTADTTLVVTKPTGLAVGDLLIMSVIHKHVTDEITGPSGWSTLNLLSGGGGKDWSSKIFYIVATAAEVAASNFSATITAGSGAAALMAFSGVDTLNPIDVSSQAVTTVVNPHTFPNVTTSVGNTMIVLIYNNGNDSTHGTWASTDPGGTPTEIADFGTAIGVDAGMGIAYIAKPAGGLTSTMQVTDTPGAEGNLHTIALRAAHSGYTASSTAIIGAARVELATSSPSVYYSTGTYASAVLDLGGGADFSTLSWNATTTASTTQWTQTNNGTTLTGFKLSGYTTSSVDISGTGDSASIALSLQPASFLKGYLWNTVDTGSYSVPAFADLDGDGDQDLLIGDDLGASKGYQNTGSVSSPIWTATTTWDISDIGAAASPVFADLDNDGDQDLLIGENTGFSYAYQNTGSASSPIWTAATTTWNAPDVGVNARPAFADLDGDGDQDLLIGENTGFSYAYQNTGSASSPIWTAATTTWSAPDVGASAAPAFADLDGDGDQDLLIGENAGISYGYQNTGSASSPIWTAATTWNTQDVGTLVRPAFADLDGDGDKDLLIGESTGISYGSDNMGDSTNPMFRFLALTAWNTTDTGSYASPAFADLDNDGDQDLLIGDGGGVSLGYQNTGSASSPVWTANIAWNAPDVGFYAAPAFADLDNDGDQDLLIGSGSNLGISYGYQNTGSVSSPAWTATTTWNAPDLGDYSTPAFADLDNDGDQDLLIGDTFGFSYGYQNTGSASAPVWTATTTWNSLDMGSRSQPAFADLDNDGDQDLLIGEQLGTIYGYQNTGSASSPIWTFNTMWYLPDVGSYAAPAFADLDGDGDKDLLIGDQTGVSFAYRNGLGISYYSSGVYTSAVKAVGSGLQFGTVSWSETLNGESVAVKVRSCNDSACSGETGFGSLASTTTGTDISSLSGVTDSDGWVQYQVLLSTASSTRTPTLNSVTIQHDALSIDMRAGTSSVPDANWTSWQVMGYGTSSSPVSLGSTFDGKRYVQYRVNLATVDTSTTPSLNDITLTYNQYAASGNLVSSPYNSTDATNVFDKISWAASDTDSSQTVQLQVRSSSTEAGLTNAPWCGYADCSGSTYVTSTTNGVSFASGHPLKTGTNDQWFQYKITLNGGGTSTPVVSAVTSTYVVNAAPLFETSVFPPNGVSSTVSTSTNDSLWGKMRVQYQIKDVDTVTASTTVSFQYSTSSGSTWTSIASSALGASDAGDKVVSSSSFTQYSATWNPASSSVNQYGTNAQFRITVNDGEAANNLAYATSTFTFDTSKPTSTATTLLIDNSSSAVNTTSSAITLKLQNVTGDAAGEIIYVRFASSSVWYGANSDGFLTANSWGNGIAISSLSATTWAWTLRARQETITAQITDTYGNGSDGTISDTNTAGYNDTPTFDPGNPVTAHQIATSTDSNWGKVAITYSVRDTDTNIGENTSGYVSSSFEYSTSSGSVWNTISASSLSAGAMSNTAVSTSSYTSSTVYWDVKTDVTQQYFTTMKIRVNVNDHEPILNTASSTTSVFTIDSKNPVLGATTTVFDAGVAGSTSSASLTIYKPTDDSSLYYQVVDATSTHSSPSSSAWTSITIATTSLAWTFDSDIEAKSINVRYRDAYGNYTATSTVSTISPSNPNSFLIQDVSKVSTGDWRMYIAWEAATSSLFDIYILEYATSSNGTTFGSSTSLTTISDISTNYYVHLNLSSSTYYKYRLGVRDDNQNITVRSTAGTVGKPDGVQNNDEGGGGTSPRAAVVTQVLPAQGSDGNVTVTYKLTDGSYTTKTSPSYEAYLFYNTGVVASGTSPYNEGASTLSLSSASTMASSGIIQVNNEVMQYTGKSGNTLTGITRGTWPTLNSSGRTTRSNSSFLDGTPVWIKASSTSDIAITASAAEIQSGYDCTGNCSIVWTMAQETGLAGNSFSNVGVRVLVHDNQAASSSPLSSQNDLSENGTLSTLDVTAPTIYFSTSTMSGAESVTAATATLQLARAYPRDVTVTYTITGSATIGSGNDFTVANSSSTTGTSTISAGATSTTIGIQIVGDSTSEANETIILTLSSPTNATVGSTSTLTYIITDDDTQPTISFSSASSSGSEGTTPASFTVVLSGTAGQAVEFTYAVSSTASTATGNGTDYTLVNGTSSIAAGATSTTINATLIDDAQYEASETLVLTLASSTGATLGATTTYTYTILDNETLPVVYFDTIASSGAESVTPVNIRIILSAVSGQNVEVGYMLVSASTTAVLGTDYTLAEGVLTSGTSTIIAGNTSTTLALQITDDSTGESSETIKLSLSGAVNSTVGATSTFLYTITDNDNGAPQLDASFGTNGILVHQIATSSDAHFGKVRVEYSFRDTTSATATPSFAYSLDGGSTWASISSGALASGDVNGKSATSTYATSTATWSVSSTLPLTYASSAKIRVTLDDGDTHNNTTSSISAAFAFDSLRATSSVILNSADNVIQSTISDNSSFQYRFSNNANMSADSVNASSGVWQAFSATSTTASSSWTFATSTGYEIFYYETSDAYGNNVSSTAVVAPSEPTNFGLRDVSDVTTNKYQEFFVWDAYTAATTTAAFSKYELYRSTSSNSSGYSLLTTITSASTNYYTDTSLSSSTMYYYRLRTVDTDGDISGYATSVSDTPDGQGGTDVTGPTLTSVSSTEVQTTWAKITWYASEFSDSKVEYSTSSGVFTSSTSNTSMISSSTQHSLVISNLTADTIYYFRVTSKDAFNNSTVDSNGGSGYSFTTLGGPRITAVAVRDTTDEDATIIWNTDRDSDSIVEYSTNATLSSYASAGSASLVGGNSTSTYPHSVSLAGLTKATRYYFRVKSTDASSTLSIDNNNGSFYSFSTTNDKKAPVISSIATPLITANAAVISWATDEPSTSQVEFGVTASTTSGSYSTTTTRDNTLTRTHLVSISGLSAVTPYYFRVKSYDMNVDSPTAVSDEQTFTTPTEKETITIIIRESSGGGGDTRDTTPPIISNIEVIPTTAFEAKVSFTTNEETTGYVLFSKNESFDRVAGSPKFALQHTISLSGLQLGTIYHFQVKAQDKSGNFTTSEAKTFTTQFAAEALDELTRLENAAQFQEQLENIIESTLPSLVAPFIASIDVSDVTEGSATVTWRTNVPAFGALAYVPSSVYVASGTTPYVSEISKSDKKTRDHRIILTGLSPATTYHFQAKAFSIPGVVGKSADRTFSTKASKIRPEITRLGNTDIEVRWVTEEETSSFVDYRNLRTGKLGKTGDPARGKIHLVKVEGLEPATSYEIKVYGYAANDVLVEGDPLTATTRRDTKAPAVSGLRVDNALLPGRSDRLQAVISWKTDEPASSVVYFEEGVGLGDTLVNKVGQEREYTTDHIVIVTAFKPSTVYRMRVASSDESGNLTQSPIRTILTPRSAESVFDIVTRNLEDTFGFLKNIRQ